MTQHYDLIIIGTGAGGGTLAYALAATGKRILILERGGYLPREKDNWNPEAIFQDHKYQTQEQWLDRDNQVFSPEAFYNVGGNTKVYGAALQRMREEDFGELQHYDGVSPAWEISYSEFEPYYLRAESLYKIHGIRGEDPTEPPASAEYPFKPLHHEPRIQQITDGLENLGLHPFHLTLALNRDEDYPAQRPCIRCDTCDPYPCLVNAKCDAQVTCVDPALQHRNVELLINTRVTKLITDASGTRVTAVEAEKEGEIIKFTADTFVVSCGAINSAVLLLKSKSDRHPNGLANSSGMVGRNLMLHNHSALIAVADQPNDTIFQKTLGVNDFYFQGPNQNYPLGQIQLTGKAKWNRLKAFMPDSVPQSSLEYIAKHSVDWWLTTEDLPRWENCVTVNSEGKIKVDYQANNLKPHQDLIDIWTNYLRKLDFFLFFAKKMPIEVGWHQAGTCRFGSDPTKNVLDLNCRTHDVENLYVVDGSFFPAMGAVNPTLTIIANALRVADHFKNQ
ncbi:glucose-methanol-choline oxidoreductase [Stanieria cyanosphaera PCC 7437]|uniref:Glucose-methanol-choline oxidoreductase n=1 Tax=Stanieria cyanosphaera (strain ATCC 29371 / PCC 7437) TaxID=111780 RepID=K9XQY0_STAC7|nr:GMC family oxidoreductase [Stanieria cyanosphaera]AFZ34471.1 glucose-methanol-choline oxidoreductase [Stanieria cyanosphaera PCC 7437]